MFVNIDDQRRGERAEKRKSPNRPDHDLSLSAKCLLLVERINKAAQKYGHGINMGECHSNQQLNTSICDGEEGVISVGCSKRTICIFWLN